MSDLTAGTIMSMRGIINHALTGGDPEGALRAIDNMLAANRTAPRPDDALDLLAEWMAWWWDTDEAPAKMPDALHIRTALALVAAGRDVPPMTGGITTLPDPRRTARG